MTVNHQGKYFIIRKRFWIGRNRKWDTEKEQSKIICYRTEKIETKPTNQPQQWQQQQQQQKRTGFFLFCVVSVVSFLVCDVINSERERGRVQKKIEDTNFCCMFSSLSSPPSWAYWRCSRLKMLIECATFGCGTHNRQWWRYREKSLSHSDEFYGLNVTTRLRRIPLPVAVLSHLCTIFSLSALLCVCSVFFFLLGLAVLCCGSAPYVLYIMHSSFSIVFGLSESSCTRAQTSLSLSRVPSFSFSPLLLLDFIFSRVLFYLYSE